MAHAESTQLRLFADRLPQRPYATDDFTFGLRILPQQAAIRSRYVQPNHPLFRTWIVVDVDRPGAGLDWYDRGAPDPNIVATNPENGHSHLFFALENPIYADPLEGSQKALKYAAAVEYGLVSKLAGDFGYAGLMAKNPLHSHWIVRTYQRWMYDLEWLSDFIDLPDKIDARRKMPEYGLGRNCQLFDGLRRWAYREVKNHWNGGSFPGFFDAVEIQAAVLNTHFATPMMWAEVKHIVKSVSRWTWKHFTPAEFARIQAARKRKDSERRRMVAAERAQQVLAFMKDNPGAPQTAVAEAFGINQATVSRYARTISEGSGLWRPESV